MILNLKIRLKIWVRNLVKEVATKTNDVAGDGTTTATVLAQAMVRTRACAISVAGA